jgi:hypothetical protein
LACCGVQGINGDDRLLFGTEADGTVLAWKRDDGGDVWSVPALPGLTAPFLAGRSVVIGDATSFIHLLSREDGSLLNRSTDGSPISASRCWRAAPLVAVTRNGGGWPE